MIPYLAVVRLRKPDLLHNVSTEDAGAVVRIPGDGEAYSVAFMDEDGNENKAALDAVYTEDQLEVIWVLDKD